MEGLGLGIGTEMAEGHEVMRDSMMFQKVY